MPFPPVQPLEIYPSSTMGWPLGISWRQNRENIDIKEASQLDNCEYDQADSSIRTCDGVTIKYDAGIPVETLFYDHVNDTRYFSSGNSLYKTDLTTKTLLGSLTGTFSPIFHMYGNVCLVASGGQLQRITGGSTLQTLSNSPLCHFITSRLGRVVVWHRQSDVRNYSAIGDENGWTNIPSDPSSSQFADVGYKDPGNIISECIIANMVLVFKEFGRVYQITGEPQDSNFSVLPFSETSSCMNPKCALPVDNKAFYLGKSGFMNYIPTQAYGNITPQEAGININAQLAKNTDSTACIFHIQPKKQIMIRSQNENRVYLYHYLQRYPYDEETGARGAFTTRSFKYVLNDISVVGSDVYIAYGNKIGILNQFTDLDDDMQIQTSIQGKNQLPVKRHLLIRSKSFFAKNLIAGNGSLKLGKKPAVQLTFSAGSPKVFGNTDKVFNNTNKVFASTTTRYYKIGGGGGNNSLQVQIIVQKGAIAIRQMDYSYSEV